MTALLGDRDRWQRHGDLLIVAGLLVLAAALRFGGLDGRGTWDADQGHDMLVLRGLVRDGTIPLLGPPTSIGDFHHGALYYYLLGPAAALGGGDEPLTVVGAIAAMGVAAVGVTWWLARAIGGSWAGVIAGLLMAVSATSINESTFIWNPNLIPLSSAIALSGAWQAWRSRRPRWWLVAAAGQLVTMQSHVLGSVLLPGLALLWAADLRRRRGMSHDQGRTADPGRRAVVLAGLGAVALLALGWLPLAVHELTHDFSESRAAADFVLHGGVPVALDPLTRLAFVALRILAWPFTGLVTDAPGAAVLGVTSLTVVVAWRLREAVTPEREAIGWLGATVGLGILLLGFGVAGLTTVTPLPVDHYHAFLDPALFVVAGVGTAALIARGAVGRLLALVGVGAALSFNVATWPLPVASDGGWPAAQAAAARIGTSIGDRPTALVSLPVFKTPEAYAYPLVRDGRRLVEPAEAPARIVVICDALFVTDCGGPAERTVSDWPVLDRFAAAPGRTVTVLGPP